MFITGNASDTMKATIAKARIIKKSMIFLFKNIYKAYNNQ